MTHRRSWLAWALAAFIAAIGGFWLARQLDSSGVQLASGTWLDRPRPVAGFSVVDHTGRAFTQTDLQGKPTLVFFGFTHCPDVCPTTLAKMAKVANSPGVPDVRVLFVSVDPERDTPQAVAKYIQAFDPEFTGVTGDPQAIEKLAASFSVAVAKVDLPGGGYTMDHSAALFLLDDRARMVAVFTPPFDVARIADDLRRAASDLKT
jgi:protein SCO1